MINQGCQLQVIIRASVAVVALVLLPFPAPAEGRHVAAKRTANAAQAKSPWLAVRQLGVPRNVSSAIHAIEWSPDGSVLAAAYRDGMVRLWTEVHPAPVAAFRAHDGEVSVLDWNPVGNSFATGGTDGTIKIWDAVSRSADRVIRTQAWGRLAWSPDGKTLASRGGDDYAILLWDAQTWKERERISYESLEAHTDHVTWSPDGRFLALSGGNRRYVTIWDVKNRRPVTSEPMTFADGHEPVIWSPDGATCAQAHFDIGVVVWDAESERKTATLVGTPPFPSVIAVAWSQTGNQIAAICGNGQAIVWDGNSHDEVARFEYDKSSAKFVAWRPDGKVLAIATDLAISFWQVG